MNDGATPMTGAAFLFSWCNCAQASADRRKRISDEA